MVTARIRLRYLPLQLEVFFPKNPVRYTIVPKGRRASLTKGAANAFMEYCLDDDIPLLWGDTINGNIDKYYERYFLPELKQFEREGINYKWSEKKRELKIAGSTIDFRSEDNPHNWEGYGYKKIFLNEAGIILKNPYLYNNAILPMMLDYQDSQLIAAGTPKGKFMKDGSKHKFFELWEKAEAGDKDYRGLCYSTYHNFLLSPEDIKELENEIPPEDVLQELYGQFIDKATGRHPFVYSLKDSHLDNHVEFDPRKQLIISVDFNLEPFAAEILHYWEDNIPHLYAFDEFEVFGGSIPEMADRIINKYGAYLPLGILSGDITGDSATLGRRDNASYFQQLLYALKMSRSQLKLSGNPNHQQSRVDCNYFMTHFDFKVNGNNCPGLVRDLKHVQVDSFGEIMKKNRKYVNQRADFIDAGLRIPVNTFAKAAIKRTMKGAGYNYPEPYTDFKKIISG